MRAMFMAVWTFLALSITLIIYAWLGQGGGVAGLVFFGVMLIGVITNMVLKGLFPAGPERPRA
jgi:hypothetical protein